MRRTPVPLSCLALGVAMLACNALSPQAKVAIDTPTVGAAGGSLTPAAAVTTSSATETPAPSDTEPPLAATISPLLTSVPGIAATLTAVYSAPGVVSTVMAQQTMAAGTQAALFPQLSTSLLKQCPNPSDLPKQSWVDVPVMPQATAGKVVQTLIGSYYCFRAPATVQEMEAFYKEQLAPRDGCYKAMRTALWNSLV